MKNITEEIEKNLLLNINRLPLIKTRKISKSNPYCLLDETFETIEEIKTLKTRLYTHQKTIIKAMISLENKRTLNFGEYTIDYNMGFLTDPVGSGKTINILGLIASNNVQYINNIVCYDGSADIPNIEIKNIDMPKVKANIIVVNTTVIKQWEKAITDFTDLTYFSVDNIVNLRKVMSFSVDELNKYDIILVKHSQTNGKISFNNLVYEDIYIYEGIYLLNIIWQRFIIDDFDNIKFNSVFKNLKANFTWYISSTKRKPKNMYDILMSYDNIMRFNNYSKDIIKNNFLYNVVNVKNDSRYLELSLTLPIINFYLVQHTNKNDIFLDMLSGEYETDDKIIELLNGDAIKKISGLLNIEAKSIDEVFESIIGNKYIAYNKSLSMIEFIDTILSKEYETNKDYSYKKINLYEKIIPEFTNPAIKKLLLDEKQANEKIKNEFKMQIDRIKSHITHNACPICYGDLNTDECAECVILKCCNQIFCMPCILSSFNIKFIMDFTGNFSCPMCRANVIMNDIIYLGNKIEIFNDIKNCKDIKKIENVKIINKTTNNKFDNLINLFNDNIIYEKVDIKMGNILKGNRNSEMPPYKKVIIFASESEILHNAENTLNEYGIKFWHLLGTAKQISNIANTFTETTENCALLVNSENHCSGLNLQTSTDIIFLHNLLNIHVEEQTIGRGYRIGRTYPLNVWYFQYKNEYTRMKRTHLL